MIASAGDDGNVILWVPSELGSTNFGSDTQDEKEAWRVKHMCRSSGAEIYDLAWSPDATYFIIGSMDNTARIYNASTGMTRIPSPRIGLTSRRQPRSPDRRAQSLRPGRHLGSAQRVYCDTILRSIRPRLFSPDQGWAVHPQP